MQRRGRPARVSALVRVLACAALTGAGAGERADRTTPGARVPATVLERVGRILSIGTSAEHIKLSEQGFDILAEALSDDNPVVRSNAALAIGKASDRAQVSEEVIGSLAEALQDGDKQVRVRAAWALWRASRRSRLPTTVMRALVEAARDGGREMADAAAWAVRSEAARAIGEVVRNHAAVEDSTEVFAKAVGKSVDGHAEPEQAAGEPSETLYDDDRDHEEFEAIVEAASSGEVSEEDVGRFGEFLQHMERDFRFAAAWAAGRAAADHDLPNGVIAALATLLRDAKEGQGVRAEAAWAIGEAASRREVPEEAIVALGEAAVRDSAEVVRDNAMKAIGRAESSNRIPRGIRHLEGPHGV